MNDIKIVYVEIGDKEFAKTLFAPKEQASQIKDSILSALGITRRDGEKHLDAYIRKVCEMNGFEYTKPAPKPIADAIASSNIHVKRLLFALA